MEKESKFILAESPPSLRFRFKICLDRMFVNVGRDRSMVSFKTLNQAENEHIFG